MVKWPAEDNGRKNASGNGKPDRLHAIIDYARKIRADTMICIIALIVFAIMAIFSAKYRPLAKEAFDCVFRRLTLRKCESRLDERIKATIVAKTLPHSPRIARGLNKYFEVFSWIMVIITFVSLFFSAQAVYNYVVYNNCNGPDGGVCVFNLLSNGSTSSSISSCSTGGPQGPLTAPAIGGGISQGSNASAVKLIEFGCYDCPNTATMEAIIQQVRQNYGNRIYFEFKPFPIPTHKGSRLTTEAALCAAQQGAEAYWRYHAILFENQDKTSQGTDELEQLAGQMNLNTSALSECLANNQTSAQVQVLYEQGIASGIYGTPTFFINDRPLVGIKTYSDFQQIIDQELAKKA